MADRGHGLSRSVLPTSEGLAAVQLAVPAGDARALVVLGHGAGGGVEAPDLAGLAAAMPLAGYAVARVEQPYRVAGRRTPPPARRLDSAWYDVLAGLRARPELARLPLVVGGRSSGARVAARSSAAVGATAVLGLAFPLRPPGRGTSRLDELLGVQVPVLVVQGSRDAFGSAADFPALPASVELVGVPGADHSFRCRRADGRTASQCVEDVVRAVADWLERVVDPAGYASAPAVTKTLAATPSGTALAPADVRSANPSAPGPTTSTTASGTSPQRSSSSM